MYTPTYTDTIGRTRHAMGYYTLNKVQSAAFPACAGFIVQAATKQSAANKLNALLFKEYRVRYRFIAQNMKAVPLTDGLLYQYRELCKTAQQDEPPMPAPNTYMLYDEATGKVLVMVFSEEEMTEWIREHPNYLSDEARYWVKAEGLTMNISKWLEWFGDL